MPESISEVREKMPVFSLGLTIYSAVKWWDLWTLTARMEISDHALWNHKMGWLSKVSKKSEKYELFDSLAVFLNGDYGAISATLDRPTTIIVKRSVMWHYREADLDKRHFGARCRHKSCELRGWLPLYASQPPAV